MKKVLSIILILFIIFSFIGCAGISLNNDSGDSIYQTRGTVTYIKSDLITIKTNKEKSFTFETEKVNDKPSKISLGDTLLITYFGDIKKGSEKVKVMEILKDGSETFCQTGTLVSQTSEILTIATEQGNLAFQISGAEIHYKNGLVVGNQVSVNYIEYANGVKRVAEVTDFNKEAPEKLLKSFYKVEKAEKLAYGLIPASIRSCPSHTSSRIDIIEKNEEVKVTEVLGSGWSKITYSEDKEGYVYSLYLTDEKEESQANDVKEVKEETKEEIKEVKGTVCEIGNNIFVVDVVSKGTVTRISFDVKTSPIHVLKGTTAGSELIFKYKGELFTNITQNMEIIEVID